MPILFRTPYEFGGLSAAFEKYGTSRNADEIDIKIKSYHNILQRITMIT